MFIFDRTQSRTFIFGEDIKSDNLDQYILLALDVIMGKWNGKKDLSLFSVIFVFAENDIERLILIEMFFFIYAS